MFESVVSHRIVILTCRRFTNGKRVAATNHKINDFNGHQNEITDSASHIIRHIVAVYNIPPEKFPGLWACFSVLILRRVPTLQEFSAGVTIQRRIMRLAQYESKETSDLFEEFITRPSKYGFLRYWYQSSDDSIHHKRNRHVLLGSMHDGSPCDEYAYPKFRFFSGGVSYKKGGEANAQKNLDIYKSAGISLKVLERQGGGQLTMPLMLSMRRTIVSGV